jgi:type IV secretion system coupling TraD/TrwB family protein
LRKRLALDQHRLRIGGVAFPRKLESLHLLITGATGAGKSQTIQGTLDTIRGRGDTAILTDIGSEALRGFGQSGDWLLNPLDARSAPWSPFAEMSGPADAESYTHVSTLHQPPQTLQARRSSRRFRTYCRRAGRGAAGCGLGSS